MMMRLAMQSGPPPKWRGWPSTSPLCSLTTWCSSTIMLLGEIWGRRAQPESMMHYRCFYPVPWSTSSHSSPAENIKSFRSLKLSDLQHLWIVWPCKSHDFYFFFCFPDTQGLAYPPITTAHVSIVLWWLLISFSVVAEVSASFLH